MRRPFRLAHVGMLAGALLLTDTGGARSLHGQLTASVEAGAARVDQAGFTTSGVVTGGGSLRWAGPRWTASAELLGVAGANGGGTAQATTTASAFLRPFGDAVLELSSMGTAFAATSQLPVTAGQLFARQYHGVGSGGVFYGMGAGRTAWAAASLPVTTAQAGLWTRLGREQLAAGTLVTLTQSEFRTPIAGGEMRTVFDVRYADLSASWRHVEDRLTVAATGGLRLGIEHVDGRSTWGAASAELALGGGFALVGNAGRSAADYVRGVPASRYLSVALRAGSHTAASSRAEAPRGPALSVEREGDRQSVRIRGVPGARVEIMADFTDWQPVPLTGGPPDWSVERAVSPGLHRILMRIDGGEWMVPPNLTRGRSDFGVPVGLLTVL